MKAPELKLIPVVSRVAKKKKKRTIKTQTGFFLGFFKLTSDHQVIIFPSWRFSETVFCSEDQKEERACCSSQDFLCLSQLTKLTIGMQETKEHVQTMISYSPFMLQCVMSTSIHQVNLLNQYVT